MVALFNRTRRETFIGTRKPEPSGFAVQFSSSIVKYLELGGPTGLLGYPLTDESGTPSGTGRYNDFEGGSIYYSVMTGAHEIHGRIREHWIDHGRDQSFLGYPILDQKDNVSQFQRGLIQLTNDQLQTVADARFVHTGVIHVDGAAANGWAELTITSAGTWKFNGSIRSTGALSYDVALAMAFNFSDSTGRGIAFVEEGDVEGTLILGGNREHTWERSGYDPFIENNFDALRNVRVTSALRVDFGLGDVLLLLGSGLGIGLLVVGAVLGGRHIDTEMKSCGFKTTRRWDPVERREVEVTGFIWVPKGEPCPP